METELYQRIAPLLIVAAVVAVILIVAYALTNRFSLNSIKRRTVGDGQYGNARWAAKAEIKQIYKQIDFDPEAWRKGENLPAVQGVIVGCTGHKHTVALIVDQDVHAMIVGAAGIGKTAYFLYPNLEYACAAGMSFLATDTKGDVYRNYTQIAKEYYGYKTVIVDLRNPTRSDGNNFLHLVNRYMDLALANPDNLTYRAKAEKYAKIISKTVILSGASSASFGQNTYFYDAAEGLLTATILLVAEFCPKNTRHIPSVFKILQELLEPMEGGGNQFQHILTMLPPEHKARWFAGSALNSSEQTMMSVISTALSRLNIFLDSEMEQILCFDTALDAERFCHEKTAVFLVMPEEDNSKYFMISMIIQQFYREILAIADEEGGQLPNRVMMYLDEFGTIPKIEAAEMMFSASRSRRISIVPIIQSFAQLNKNYGKEGAEIIVDNTQLTIFGGFAPLSKSAETLSKGLGEQTVQSGSVSRGGKNPSQTAQMIGRRLATSDELKDLPLGTFVVMKTGAHPMQTKLKLYKEWGIELPEHPYLPPEKAGRAVTYADRQMLIEAISQKYPELVAMAAAKQAAKAAAAKSPAASKSGRVARHEEAFDAEAFEDEPPKRMRVRSPKM